MCTNVREEKSEQQIKGSKEKKKGNGRRKRKRRRVFCFFMCLTFSSSQLRSQLPPSSASSSPGGEGVTWFTLLPGDRQPHSCSQSEAERHSILPLYWSTAPRNSFHYECPYHCVVWRCWRQLCRLLSLFRPPFSCRLPFTLIRTHTDSTGRHSTLRDHGKKKQRHEPHSNEFLYFISFITNHVKAANINIFTQFVHPGKTTSQMYSQKIVTDTWY